MAVSKELLDILVCPETKQDLTLANESLVETINRMITKGKLKNKIGEEVKEPVNGVLVRSDKKVAYLIREDIPIMLIDEAVPMEQIK